MNTHCQHRHMPRTLVVIVEIQSFLWYLFALKMGLLSKLPYSPRKEDLLSIFGVLIKSKDFKSSLYLPWVGKN